MDNYHLTKNQSGDWSLKREGGERATQNFPGLNKDEAIRKAADHLKQTNSDSSLKIHREDGTFQEERTYPRSADPSQSPG